MLHFIFSQYQHVSLTHTLEKVKQVALKFNPETLYIIFILFIQKKSTK